MTRPVHIDVVRGVRSAGIDLRLSGHSRRCIFDYLKNMAYLKGHEQHSSIFLQQQPWR
ncbi:unnamed protein product [Ectocarpus sp. CCAP 1310/34]|nr:unnamed protein product [Ectocarpus sp. CCAP 1310/34]